LPIADFSIGNRQLAIDNDLVLIEKRALHLPFGDIELSLRAATQTFSIGASIAGEGPAQLRMPATKHSRHQIAESTDNG